MDDVSIRSSQDSSDHRLKKPEVDLDLPSDGGSTFRDFVPREVQSLEKQINRRDTEKQARINFKTGDVAFTDPEIKPLLNLVPLAYEKMAKMPYVYQQVQEGQLTRSQIKKSVNRVEELLEQISAI